MNQHKAVVRHGTQCAIEYLTENEAGPGELLIAPEKVSICGTDIQILRGLRDDPAQVVGHEGLAIVMEVGTGVTQFSVGDRVMINPTHPADQNFLLGHNINGLLQQRVRIPATAVSGGLVSHVSRSLPAARGTLVEPLAVVTYALECLRLEEPDSVLILGDGLIGNLAAIVAPRMLGKELPIGVVHRSESGSEWTQAFQPDTANGYAVSDVEAALRSRVALLSATHRGGTIPGLTEATQVLGKRLAAAHLIGGVAPGNMSSVLPGVDPHGVRMANTGGAWPPSRISFSDTDRSLVLTGNRGVPNSRLEQAANLLTDPEFGSLADRLITHDLPLAPGVDTLNTMLASQSRLVGGQLVMRLVIGLAGE